MGPEISGQLAEGTLKGRLTKDTSRRQSMDGANYQHSVPESNRKPDVFHSLHQTGYYAYN